jgi:hypothetical protein
MREKGYVMKNGKVIITDESAKLICTLRESGLPSLEYTMDNLKKILLPESISVEPEEADSIYETIMDISLNPDSIEKYVERIKRKDTEKQMKNKIRDYL